MPSIRVLLHDGDYLDVGDVHIMHVGMERGFAKLVISYPKGWNVVDVRTAPEREAVQATRERGA